MHRQRQRNIALSLKEMTANSLWRKPLELSPSLLIVCILGLITTASGCTDRQRTPPLVNEALYSYEKIGLLFFTPQGWSITSRALLPPGPLAEPKILVAYHLKDNEYPAALEVLAADLPEETDLGQYLLESRVGRELWTVKSQPESITVNGTAAFRFQLSHRTGENEDLRETTAFRRGGRVYFFIVSFVSGDHNSLNIGRKSIETVTWQKL